MDGTSSASWPEDRWEPGGFVFGSLFDTDSNDAGSYYGEEPTHGTTYTGQRNSFLFSMLVMASYIIRADGRIMHSEMEFVRRFLRSTFGEGCRGRGRTDTAQPLRTAQADGQTKPTGI